MANKELAARLKQIRGSLNLKLTEAAEKIGFPSYQTLSSIENGEREVKASELSKFSKAYYCSIEKLLGKTDIEPAVSFIWRNSPKERKNEIEREILYQCEKYSMLENLLNITKRESFLKVSLEDISTNYKVEVLANNISTLLGLGRRPAFTLQKVLEQDYGIKILCYPFIDGSAVSTVNTSIGNIIVINSHEVPWRQNYDLAHELFHLITWDAVIENQMYTNDEYNEEIEKKANLFASILLLPEQEVKKEVLNRVDKDGNINNSDIVDIAIDFGISTQALIYRLANLKLISFEQAGTVVKDEELSKLSQQMRKQEKIEKRLSDQFVALAIRCLRKALISRGKFSELVDIDRSDIDDFINDKGLMRQEGNSVEIMAS